LSLNFVTCLDWLRHPDDGFTLMLAYMEQHVPTGTAVDIAAGTPPPSQTDGGRYALQDRYRAELWTTPAALNQQHVDYIMVEWGPIQEGYAYLNTAQVGDLIRQSHSRLVFSFSGRSYGHLSLYKVPSV